MKHWFFGITLIMVSVLLLAACGDDESETPRPTEIRIITSEPEVANLQGTISALETRQAEMETEDAADAAPTNTPEAIAQGVVIGGDAIVFADADDGATELARLPANTEVVIIGEAEPNRIGVVFYNIRHDGLTGWVASTQIQVQESQPETPAATQADTDTPVPVTPTITDTPRPTATFPPSPTPTITPTPLPIGFPTPERYSVVVVEQVFERGFMIWLEPIRQIWVLTGDEVDPTEGTWECYDDTFEEGMPERDPSLEPAEGTTTASQFEGGTPMQPIRGFGKVWRDNFDVREALGWALNPEIKHSTVYEYFAGGEMDDGEYDPAPGEYRVESLFQYTLVLHEDVRRAPCEDLTGTWEIR